MARSEWGRTYRNPTKFSVGDVVVERKDRSRGRAQVIYIGPAVGASRGLWHSASDRPDDPSRVILVVKWLVGHSKGAMEYVFIEDADTYFMDATFVAPGAHQPVFGRCPDCGSSLAPSGYCDVCKENKLGVPSGQAYRNPMVYCHACRKAVVATCDGCGINLCEDHVHVQARKTFCERCRPHRNPARCLRCGATDVSTVVYNNENDSYVQMFGPTPVCVLCYEAIVQKGRFFTEKGMGGRKVKRNPRSRWSPPHGQRDVACIDRHFFNVGVRDGKFNVWDPPPATIPQRYQRAYLEGFRSGQRTSAVMTRPPVPGMHTVVGVPGPFGVREYDLDEPDVVNPCGSHRR